LHAHTVSEVGLSTGTKMIVAAFRAHHTKVTLGQLLEAGVAIALAETLLSGAPTMVTFNVSSIAKPNFAAY
tara:strand:+ start:4373 stop:4585 length:213 start_codon:yes stop_codon:yes gene_type:complete